MSFTFKLCYLDCIQYTLGGFEMNKTALLTVGLIASVAAVFSYVFIANEQEQQPAQQLAESIVVEKSEHVSSSEQANDLTHAHDESSSQETVLVADASQTRSAPPPPIQSNKTRDGRYTSPKAHGHEEVHNHDDDKKNAPPPPTGAN